LQSQIEELDVEEITRYTRGDIDKLFIGTEVCIQEQLGPDAHSTEMGDINVNVGQQQNYLGSHYRYLMASTLNIKTL